MKVKFDTFNTYVAWATWILINIHPKIDGNGRLAKGLAEYLFPDKRILGYKSDLWTQTFHLTDQELMEKVAQKQGIPLPPRRKPVVEVVYLLRNRKSRPVGIEENKDKNNQQTITNNQKFFPHTLHIPHSS